MCKLQNIYINSNGELNTDCRGRLCSLEDLENSICEGSEEINGLLQLADGQYKWQSVEMQRKILEMDNDITEEELEELEGHYLKFSNIIPSLYAEFINDLDLELTQILSTNINEDNTSLFAVAKMISDQWNYIYNYFIDFQGELQKNVIMIPNFMLKTTCNASSSNQSN